MNNKIKIPLILFALAMALYVTGLGATALLDPDEPVYAQTAREMVETGSWLTPRLNGLLWFDKPPMYFWLSAVSFKIFSVGEFAARFPSCLMAALLIMLVYIWARRAFDEKIALYSSLCLSVSLLFSFIARAAVTDMTLCFFMNLSFYMIYLAGVMPEKRFKYINLFYFFSGFSVLTKGPVGLVLPLIVIMAFLACRRDWKFLRALYSPAGFALFALSALPWYIAMLLLHGTQFFNTFIGYHNLIRFLEPEHVRSSSVFFYVPVLIAGFFPHMAPLGAFIKDFFVKIFTRDFYARYIFVKDDMTSDRAAASLSLLIFISACIFGFFSIAKTKLVTYIMPMFPAFAIITGYYYNKLSVSGRKNPAGAVLSLLLGGALAYGFYAVAPVKIAIVNPAPFFYLSIAAAAITALNLFFSLSSARRPFIYLNCSMMAVFLLTLNLSLLPQFGALHSSRDICLLIKKEIKPGEKLGYFSKTMSALFYSDVSITHVNESASSRMGAGKVSGAQAAVSAEKKYDAGGDESINFVRNIKPLEIAEAYKYIDKFRKFRNFMSHKEKVYVIMLNSDFQNYSQEIKINHKPGPVAGKYTYITNK
jgi:4-amino-4-deoxy-L-arabinose transferase-like glycosyltransferase